MEDGFKARMGMEGFYAEKQLMRSMSPKELKDAEITHGEREPKPSDVFSY